MSWPEASAGGRGVDVSSRSAEFAKSLHQHVRDGLSPELALDLALNELVVAATRSIHASAAAVALARGGEMVCRATTGDHAPELGIPIHTRTGLSGACVRSRRAQNCRDTESDERVDPDVSHHLGIRSILVVPILDRDEPVGIIEAFSSQPSAFSDSDELLLQEFAFDCLKLRQLSVELPQRPYHKLEEPISVASSAAQAARTGADDHRFQPPPSLPKVEDLSPTRETLDTFPPPPGKPRSPADFWTLLLAALVAAAAIALIFLIAFRMGWLGSYPTHPARAQTPQPLASEQNASMKKLEMSEGKSEEGLVVTSQSGQVDLPASAGLVIYERGKVIFRSPPTPSKSDLHAPPSVAASARNVARVWLSPAAAEALLRDRIEPEYPEAARAAHRSGDVTLQILVRKDGSVASVRTVKGDRLLSAAATAAVRHWHYEPYQVKGQTREFQADVTIKFSLSE